MKKIQKKYNKIVRKIVCIPNKFINIPMGLSAGIALMFYIPKFTDYLKGASAKLDNDIVKGIITIFTDFNTLIEEAKVYMNINESIILYSMLGIFLVCIILTIIKLIYSNKEIIDKVIIGHSSMSESQFMVETDDEYKIEYIDLIDDMKDTKDDYDKIKYAINKQDGLVKAFKRTIDNKHEYGYMGIAHTPLILRMGNQIGDEVGIDFFHKSRTEGENTTEYIELNQDENFKNLKVTTKILNKSSDELIVGLYTTYEIKYDELKVFNPDNKNILIFSSEDLGFDVIKSELQVKHYVQDMMKNVRKVVKDNNITKIHMVLSTSSVMTFALGQAISLNNDPNVTIYHYDINNQRKYTWGIDLSKEYNECVVSTENFYNVTN
ncbi:MAG: SAVED domain-containing protein [Paeniclostridium sordellii]|nr:SAVED domain-containing protein [uncultured Romboutsia sp.]MDU2591784.1 SAVED domain-containing protein [Paeniclostridium sordellii]